jgi:hypothetical protein
MSNPLRLDALTLPVKYLALCKIMGDLTDTTVGEIDTQVEMFILETSFEATEVPEEEVHLNG